MGLLDFFSPLFSLGLRLERSQDGASPATFKAEALRLLDAARAAARAAGKREHDVKEASFAVVAWLDEAIARHPEGMESGPPLQVALFDTANAGDEFFEHLQRLGADRDEVREVYFTALCLGFVGQYYFDAGEGGELQRLKDLHARQLPIAPAAVHTLHEEKITPQPYLAPDPGPPKLPSRWDEYLLKGAVAVAVVAPIALLLYYLLRAGPDPAPDLKRLIAAYRCSELSFEKDSRNNVTVNGRVPTPEEREKLLREAQAVPGVRSVASQVTLLMWPYCEVAEILGPYKDQNRAKQMGLVLAPHKGSTDYYEGEDLVLDLAAPALDAFVYVDYWQFDGHVVHLLPNPLDGANRKAPGERWTLGEPEVGRRHWEIQPPFGQEMIAVVASPTRLFDPDRPEYEAAIDYLAALRDAVAGKQIETGRLTADFFYIQTQAGK